MIKALAELALRARNLDTMKVFYRDVVGLEIYEELDEFVFFKVGELVRGHPQILGLFDRKADFGEERTRLDHFAFLVDLDALEGHATRLKELGIDVIPRTFPHFHWRSIFFSDPEGNVVEFVSHDPSV